MKFKINIAFSILLIISYFLFEDHSTKSISIFVILFILTQIQIVLGFMRIQNNHFIKAVHSLSYPKEKKYICLTFDDGPHPSQTPLVLDILKTKQVPSIFFLIGKNCVEHEAIVKRIYTEGHIVGNHSYVHHIAFDFWMSKKVKEDLNKTNTIIEKIIGQKPILFRPPFGVTNPSMAKAVKSLSLKTIGWNLRSFDTVANNEEKLLKKLKEKTKPNAIILLHDRCEITARVLTQYIDFCLDSGYTFVNTV
ncbi:MAG: polysaccharide deacetylase family protein [Chitinophagaceae bacterium]